MAWYEFHEQAREEIKIARLAVTMNVRYAEACGWMACLWAWVAGHRLDGNVSDLSPLELCNVARCELTPESFASALRQHELIDKRGHINHWARRGVKYLLSGRSRVAKHRDMKRNSNVTVTGDGNVSVTPTVPNRTVPNHTVLKKELKDGTEAPVDHSIRHFMQHLNQALKTKTGQAQTTVSRTIFGAVIAYVKRHPDQIDTLTAEIDRLPTGMKPEWYPQAIRGMIQVRNQDEVKQLTAGIGRT